MSNRSRKSKIDLLPKDIKDSLNALIRSGNMQQKDILAAVNALIEEAGLPQEAKLSRTGFNRYAKRVEEMGQKLRESREIAEVWTAKLGDAPSSSLGQLLQEAIRTLSFETSLNMLESGKVTEPKALAQLALVATRVEQAAMASHKVEKEIRAAFAEEAANALGDELRGVDGMSEELEDRIRGILLGKA